MSFKESASFNIHELDAASHNSVEDIRTLIDQIRFMPQEGKYKTYIIDEVHMLSAQAFNAFLKTLEEPPPYAIFILATTEKQKIIPTILSRCQIYDFNRIKLSDIVIYLEKICVTEKINYEKEALHIIATKADGALRDALSMFDRIVSFSEGNITLKAVLSSLNILDYEYYFKFVDAFLSEDRASVLLLYNDIQEAGFEGDILLNGLSKHLRDLLVCKAPDTMKLLDIADGLVRKPSRRRWHATTSHIFHPSLTRSIASRPIADSNHKCIVGSDRKRSTPGWSSSALPARWSSGWITTICRFRRCTPSRAVWIMRLPGS